MGDQTMFRERPDLYDRIYHFKDYAAEAARIRGYLAAAGVADGARVVEGACGTGNYLVPLAKHYKVEGFDLNEGVLGVALGKVVDGTRLSRADLAEFTVEEPADAFLCLFSSIGYVGPLERFRAAAVRIAACLRPRGVALVEAWFEPETFHPGRMTVQTYDSPEMKIVRTVVPTLDGRRSHFEFHWLVLRPTGIEHFVDSHVLWLYTRDEQLAAFKDAGLDARWIDGGLIRGRGLILARKP